MHCPYCGNEIESGLDSCPLCGESLANPEKSQKPSSGRIARPLHPFAVMGYIVLLSGLIVFLQTWQKGPLKAKLKKEGESAAAPAQAQAPVPRDEVRADNLNESDKKYMEVFKYERSLKPVFIALSEIDAQMSNPEQKMDGSQVQLMFQNLNKLAQMADALQTPSGLGMCAANVKGSVDQAKTALNAFWNYQSTHGTPNKDEYQKNLLGFRSQKDSCQNIINNLNRELEPLLSHKKPLLQKFSETYNPFPQPPVPPPSPAPQTGATAKPQTPQPAAPEPALTPGSQKKLELHEKKLPRTIGKEPQEPNQPAPEEPPQPAPPMEFDEMQQQQDTQ